MDAEVIAVGSELLRGGSADTNSSWLASRLGRIGMRVRQICLVEDDEERIAAVLGGAAARATVVILTGGLGPTEDDRTRSALARAFGLPLERDTAMAARIEEHLRRRGKRPDPGQLRQAERPRGAWFIDNPVGIAPGISMTAGTTTVHALPGVPAEMKAMFEASLEPALRARSGPTLRTRVLKVAGRTESSVDRDLRELYSWPGVEVTILARPTGVELLLRVEGATPEEADAALDRLDAAMSARLEADLFGRDEETLASVVGAALLARGRTVATAESCTAGLLSAAITEVPGASHWFRGGFVTYADDLKTDLAGASEGTIADQGAVSTAVARELARGAREKCRADYGVAITGIAGPTGARPTKPVGLVHLCVVDAEGALDFRFLLPGDRDLVRRRAVTLALDRLRRLVLGLP